MVKRTVGSFSGITEDDGIIVTIDRANNLTIPKYNGVYKADYMKTVEEK